MNFQYFFFDTYIGYFLQALPFALIAGAIYGIIRFRKDTETPMLRKVFSCAFICYLAGLVCLVIGLDLMGIFYYKLFYRMDSSREIDWLGGAIDLVPDFFNNINGEVIGNLLMLLPFGVLYPLSQKEPTWKRSVLAGLLTVVIIEAIQPIFGRSFDMNDIILNSLGVVASVSVFTGVRTALGKRQGKGKH